jgi:hypothetical protein
MGVLIAHDPPPPSPPPRPAVTAEAPAKDDYYIPDWAIGWTYGVESMHVDERNGQGTNTLALALARRVGRVQVRFEGATQIRIIGAMATSPGYGDRLGVAVRLSPLATQLGYDSHGGAALAVDLGAGEAWWFDRAGSVHGAYATLGVTGSISIGDWAQTSPSKVLITALGAHAYAFDAGWSILGCLEMDWGR